MAEITQLPNRRSFLATATKAIAALSVAAVPVATQAAVLDEWDRFSVGIVMINPRFIDAVRHARAAGMRPQWLFSVVNSQCQALLFKTPDDQLRTFYHDGEDRRAA